MKNPEMIQLLTLLDDIRRLSHRVDHVSEKVVTNVAHVENLLARLNQVSSLQTVYEEKARQMERRMNQARKSQTAAQKKNELVDS